MLSFQSFPRQYGLNESQVAPNKYLKCDDWLTKVASLVRHSCHGSYVYMTPEAVVRLHQPSTHESSFAIVIHDDGWYLHLVYSSPWFGSTHDRLKDALSVMAQLETSKLHGYISSIAQANFEKPSNSTLPRKRRSHNIAYQLQLPCFVQILMTRGGGPPSLYLTTSLHRGTCSNLSILPPLFSVNVTYTVNVTFRTSFKTYLRTFQL